VAEVVYNYSVAKIPLETMWTDIGKQWAKNSVYTSPDTLSQTTWTGEESLVRIRSASLAAWTQESPYLVMIGDAVASFLSVLNMKTVDLCTLSKETYFVVFLSIMEGRGIKSDVSSSVPGAEGIGFLHFFL
jgi:hypothetical protein